MRIVALSDTHSKHRQLPPLPAGDVLLHAGDCTNVGKEPEWLDFLQWYGSQPHATKILCPGNHDLNCFRDPGLAITQAKEHGVLLGIDQEFIVNGVKIFCCPWTPQFGNWAFMASEEMLYDEILWRIPDDVEILISHGPPKGIMDKNAYGESCGSMALKKHLGRMEKLRVNLFGHIHESYGLNRSVIDLERPWKKDETHRIENLVGRVKMSLFANCSQVGNEKSGGHDVNSERKPWVLEIPCSSNEQ